MNFLKLRPLSMSMLMSRQRLEWPTKTSLLPLGSSSFHPRLCQPSSPITTTVPARKKVTLNFRYQDGKTVTTDATLGDNLLDCIIDNDIEIDGYGACEGTLSCSTCHLIFSLSDYDSLPDKPMDEEMDMLDLAFGLTDTSRLGCQIYVTHAMNGWTIQVPEKSADARDV